MKKGVPVTPQVDETVTVMTYGEEEGDYHAENIRIGGGEIRFDFVSPEKKITDILLEYR